MYVSVSGRLAEIKQIQIMLTKWIHAIQWEVNLKFMHASAELHLR